MSAATRRSTRRNSSWCFSSSSVKRTIASSAVWSPKPVVAADLEHLRADEALDQAEHVRVGATLDLAEEAPLVGAQPIDLVDQREPVGQELLAQVELAAADDVAVDVPADPLRGFDGLRVAPYIDRRGGGGLHVVSFPKCRLIDVGRMISAHGRRCMRRMSRNAAARRPHSKRPWDWRPAGPA
jgi:hypothetical protein